jgi:RNA-directed DNA polymerase
VQAALKLVLEPIFEADFKPCSYGFRPRCRAQDAIAEIQAVLGSVKAFLRAGVLTEGGLNRETVTGTPQGDLLVALDRRTARAPRLTSRRASTRSTTPR